MSQQSPSLGPKPDLEDVRSTFDRADNRWDPGNAGRDWIIIAALVAIYLVWTGVMFLFEPGIR